MKMKNVESMFVGRFMVVARLEHEILDRTTGEVTKYWEFSLSNGSKVFPVTCGKNSPLMETKLLSVYDMEFTADFSKGYAKIKVTDVDYVPDQSGNGSNPVPSQAASAVKPNASASSQSK